MRILSGTDFSERADEAATLAALLARQTNGDLALVHVLDTRNVLFGPAPILDTIEESARERLERMADRLRALGARVDVELPAGWPDEALVAEAKRRDAALLVVPAIGRRDSAGVRLGKTCERVLRTTETPMLAVREAGPLIEWLEGKRPLRLMLAYDFTPQADAAALFAARLAALGACQPIAAFVDDPARESGRLGLAGSPARAHDHLRDEVAQRLARILPNLPIEVVVSSHEGDPSARLVHLAEREQADLVIVGSNQRGAIGRLFAGSVALDLLRDSATNVIVVPGAALPPVTQIAPVVRKVLVATDLSSVGNRAIEYAMAVAPPESEIVVVHVVSPNLMRGGRYGRASYRHFAEEHAEVVAERQQALDTLVAASARAGGAANARAELLESAEVERTLLESIERHAPDLVCIGTTGRSGIGAMLLGSTAQAVLRGCRRPLLLVQPQDR